MRVAIFSDTYPPDINGVSRTLCKIIKGFLKAGIEYRVFTPKFPGYEPCHDNVIQYKGIRCIFDETSYFSMPSKKTIQAELKDFRPDVVHILTEYSMGYAGLRVARKMNLPIVISCHTDIVTYLPYFHLSFLKGALNRHFKVFHGYGTLSLCPTESFRKLLESRGLENFKVWNHGILNHVFFPGAGQGNWRRKFNGEDKFICLNVGRLSAEKGLDIFVEAMKMVNERYEDDFLFVIAGSGKLEKQLKKSGVQNMVLTGFLDVRELAELYGDSDVFVIPSGTETFGNVLMEAQASALPCICADRGGVTSITKHGENAYVVPYGDPKALAEAIIELWQDGQLREKLSRNALTYAQDQARCSEVETLVAYYREAIKLKEKDAAGEWA